MTPSECVKLVAYLAARCPSMRLEEATPDVWFDDLKDVKFDDAAAAVRELSAKQRYVALSEILHGVHSVREDRIARFKPEELPPPPFEIADDPRATQRWLLEQRRRIADGETPEEPELPNRPVRALVEGAFKRVGGAR